MRKIPVINDKIEIIRVIFMLSIPLLLNNSISSFSYKFIKKNITPNKKINGRISKIIEGILRIVKNIG